MANLFPDPYSGEVLTVSDATHALIGRLFPEVDRASAYREADAWLLTCPKSRWPRNHQRFLINWMKREKTRTLRASEAFALKDEALRRETRVGAGPRGGLSF